MNSSDFLDWEALGEDGALIVCPACITPDEMQAMDEDMMDLMGEFGEDEP